MAEVTSPLNDADKENTPIEKSAMEKRDGKARWIENLDARMYYTGNLGMIGQKEVQENERRSNQVITSRGRR